MNPDSFGPIVTFPSVEHLAMIDHPAPVGLDDRTVHVWGFSLDGSAAALRRCRLWLSEEERARAERFIRRDDQLQYVFAHGGLRVLLARYAGVDPVALRFQAGPTGKPVVLDQQGRQHAVRFNLSHSHGRMLIAVARELDIGVDLEEIREKVEVVKLAERFYAPGEYERVLSLSGLDQARQFFRYWVAKEAVLKGQGVGLLSLQQCEILTADIPLRAVAQVTPEAAMQPGWTVQWVECGPSWIGAVSAHGSDWGVRAFNS